MDTADHTPHPAPVTRRFRLLAFVSHGANDLYWFILPIVLPLMLTEYGLRYAGGGSVLSIYLLVMAVVSAFAGRLSDRVHRWRMIGVGFLLTGVGFAATALSASLPLVVLALAVAAVGVSVFHPAMYGAIQNTVQTKRARFFGAFESWGGLTITTMIVVIGLLLRSLSWKNVLLLAAFPGAVAGVFFMFLPRPHQPARREASSGPRTPTILLAVYLVSNMLRFFAITGMVSFVPTFFVDQVGLPPASAAYAGALFFGGGVLGARLGGVLGDRLPPYRVMLSALFMIAPLMLLFGVLSSTVGLAVVLFVLGVAAMAVLPVQSVLLRQYASHMGSGEVFGIMMAGMTITQALGPFLFGVAADGLGLARSVQLFAIPALVSWGLLFALSRTRLVREQSPVTLRAQT